MSRKCRVSDYRSDVFERLSGDEPMTAARYYAYRKTAAAIGDMPPAGSGVIGVLNLLYVPELQSIYGGNPLFGRAP